MRRVTSFPGVSATFIRDLFCRKSRIKMQPGAFPYIIAHKLRELIIIVAYAERYRTPFRIEHERLVAFSAPKIVHRIEMYLLVYSNKSFRSQNGRSIIYDCIFRLLFVRESIYYFYVKNYNEYQALQGKYTIKIPPRFNFVQISLLINKFYLHLINKFCIIICAGIKRAVC